MSPLTNSAIGVDQWLSCDSILSLHNGLGDPLGSLASLRYDTNGNAPVALTPTEILMQNDSISNVGRPATQSILECSNNLPDGVDLSVLVDDVVCTAGWFECDVAKGIVSGTLPIV